MKNDPAYYEIKGKYHFNHVKALILLLEDNVLFLNDGGEEGGVRRALGISINCNDIFGWGFADAEDLPYDELENLYKMWVKDKAWGEVAWCIQRRKRMPQKPVEELIREAGIWNLEDLIKG